jgi:hypothetical protein
MGAVNSSDRIATLYSLGTWFVSGIYVLIPCIKETVMMMTTMMMIIIMTIRSTYNVAVGRVRVTTVAMDMRQCVPFSVLSSNEIFRPAVNNTA